jgi:hypothetical protein
VSQMAHTGIDFSRPKGHRQDQIRALSHLVLTRGRVCGRQLRASDRECRWMDSSPHAGSMRDKDTPPSPRPSAKPHFNIRHAVDALLEAFAALRIGPIASNWHVTLIQTSSTWGFPGFQSASVQPPPPPPPRRCAFYYSLRLDRGILSNCSLVSFCQPRAQRHCH